MVPDVEFYALQKIGEHMKALVAIIMLITLSGCVIGDCKKNELMIPKRDPDLAHRCRMDPYKPECSVN
jgi:hypothetical protein